MLDKKSLFSKKLSGKLLILSFSFVIAIAIFLDLSLGSARYAEAFAKGSPKTVILDAGHGGEDCGAIAKNGRYEKDLNLEIAFILGEYLQKDGFTVIYTRTEDKMLYKEEENIKGIRKISDLKNRLAVTQLYPEAIFVSIHMNSFTDERYSGLQVYYSENVLESRELAQKIQTSVCKSLQKENKRTIKTGESIYLLKNATIPSVLIECGFLTNKEECEKLSEKEYQKELCFSILCGIIEYGKN